MMKLGLPQAILTLLAQFYKKSIVITHCCLDSLMNLVCSFMDDQLAQACIAQITLFSAENQTSVEILEELTMHENDEISEKAQEIIEIFFEDADPEYNLNLQERTEDMDQIV